MGKKEACTFSTAFRSMMSARKMDTRMMSFMSWPMLSTIACRFLKHCSACSAAPPATMAPVAGSIGSWAERLL